MRIIFCFLFAAIIALSFAKEQTVKIRAQAYCFGHPSPNVLVELREHDAFDPDDTLASSYTDRNGNVRLTGTENEFTAIRPYLRITHTCGSKSRGQCHRISEIEIAKHHINNVEFDADRIQLDTLKYKENCN